MKIWLYFCSSIIINFYYPSIYLQRGIQFLEVCYWLLSIIISLFIFIFYAILVIKKDIMVNKNVKEIEEILKKSKSLYSYFSKYALSFGMMIFSIIMLGDKSLGCLFIFNFLQTSAFQKLMDICISVARSKEENNA